MTEIKPLGKNDEAWENLFEKYDILNSIEKSGHYIITADQIIEFREPRLMTKFDHTSNLPGLFTANKLSILPISRGSYVISRFNAYHKFEPENLSIKRASLPSHIYSLNYEKISSETIALNCAITSGIIADFTEDEELVPTVSGRMGSGKFEFDIKCDDKPFRHINVVNSQVEIDAAYEGVNYLTIFEAKRDISDDFLVRQLYYPYRMWESRIPKKIKPVFLIYSNGIYRLYEYMFENPQEYSSIVLVKQQNYSLEETKITISDIQKILQRVKLISEPNIPFPQADVFERIINLCELLSEQDLSRNDVTEKYDFDERQTSYYTDAARYLGLLDKKSGSDTVSYSLSQTGRSILKKDYKSRQLAFCSLVLSHKIFNDVLNEYLSRGIMPEKCEIVDKMKQADLYRVKSDETFCRRANTIKHWIEWIVGLVND